MAGISKEVRVIKPAKAGWTDRWMDRHTDVKDTAITGWSRE